MSDVLIAVAVAVQCEVKHIIRWFNWFRSAEEQHGPRQSKTSTDKPLSSSSPDDSFVALVLVRLESG